MNYRHYVDVIGFRAQPDSSNQPIPVEYVKLANVPCSIETVTGGEVRRGEQMQATTNKRIEMHFQDQLPPIAGDLLREMHGNVVNQEINILAAYDPTGDRKKLVVQGKANG
jgi:hypothetical protein